MNPGRTISLCSSRLAVPDHGDQMLARGAKPVVVLTCGALAASAIALGAVLRPTVPGRPVRHDKV